MAEKKKRLSTLQAALNAFHQEQSKDMVGGIEKCLVTGVAKKAQIGSTRTGAIELLILILMSLVILEKLLI